MNLIKIIEIEFHMVLVKKNLICADAFSILTNKLKLLRAIRIRFICFFKIKLQTYFI